MSGRTVLLAGYGAFGALHAEAWRGLPGVRLLLAEHDPAARARAGAAGFAEGEIFADLEPALASADLVDIVTAPRSHLPLALQALAAGKPVILEKPAVCDVAEAKTLLRAAGSIPVQVGLLLRAHPLTLRAREMMAAGSIGRLVSMTGDFSGWKRMRADSGLLENDGVHFLDLMRVFAGSPVVEVDARGRALLGGVIDDIRIDTRHASGVEGELRLGLPRGGEVEDPFVPGAVTRKVLTLSGTEGVLTLDFNRNRMFAGRVRYAEGGGGWIPEPLSLDWQAVTGATPVSLIRAGLARFLDTLDTGAPPLCTAQEGALELARLTETINRALAAPRAALRPVLQEEPA